MLGVIGANGAGKSTLLRLLGGIGRPTSGRIVVNGRIGGLLDLGGGFLRDLTGRENAMLAGVVAGLLRSEMAERLPEVVGFAELEDEIDAPLRTYSSGMQMRLAFAVAVHTDPRVLLVDEFLAVGDLAFQTKCHARIKELREEGCAILMVSHRMEDVKALCDQALWLRSGEVAALGAPDEVAAMYEEQMNIETLRRTPDAPPSVSAGGIRLVPKQNRLGSLEAEISNVELRPAGVLTSGDPLEVEFDLDARAGVRSPIFVVSITREDGTVCIDTSTRAAQVEVPDLAGRAHVHFTVDRLELGTGRYFVNVGVYETEWSYAYDHHVNAYPLQIAGPNAHRGVVAPPVRWRMESRERDHLLSGVAPARGSEGDPDVNA
jgi:lipopolysaccharide transport system ATP-binding protein